ncbi:DUF6303 family protein [Streptomyces sp. AS02]|uniref:DUF6303 family protein n=1 Tax=Streptomyces sp. AS02 TaxID=2938946 RepID=UPI0020221E86|nr:DUF6303 family protein [Streptomyces sp. AS02]MCL8014638.1 DUF6303 family protein [Streptomyces sp. AS02]
MSVFKGRWHLYVVLLNAGFTQWPEFSFGRVEPVPTFTERADALSVLGFEPVPGVEWEWTEYSADPDDPASAVTLLAAVRVRSWTGASA